MSGCVWVSNKVKGVHSAVLNKNTELWIFFPNSFSTILNPKRAVQMSMWNLTLFQRTWFKTLFHFSLWISADIYIKAPPSSLCLTPPWVFLMWLPREFLFFRTAGHKLHWRFMWALWWTEIMCLLATPFELKSFPHMRHLALPNGIEISSSESKPFRRTYHFHFTTNHFRATQTDISQSKMKLEASTWLQFAKFCPYVFWSHLFPGRPCPWRSSPVR